MYRLAVVTVFCVTFAFSACSSATSPTGRRDLFGPNALSSYDHFSDSGNPWQVAPDTLKADGVGVQSVLVRKDDEFLDGWVEIETNHVDDGGLVLRFLDNEHYYLLAIRDDSAPAPRGEENLEIYERNGPGAGGFQIVWLKDIVWPRGTTHRIRFEAVGITFSVYVDNTLIGSVNRFAAFSGGSRFGLRHYGVTPNWHDRFRKFSWRPE